MADYCDFAALRLRWRPNRFLMLPAGFDSRAKPHQKSPDFADEPAALFDRLKAVLAGNRASNGWRRTAPARGRN